MSAELAAQYLPFFFALAPIASTFVRFIGANLSEKDLSNLRAGEGGSLPKLETRDDIQYIQLPARSSALLTIRGHQILMEDETSGNPTMPGAVITVDGNISTRVWHGPHGRHIPYDEEDHTFSVVHERKTRGYVDKLARMFANMQHV